VGRSHEAAKTSDREPDRDGTTTEPFGGGFDPTAESEERCRAAAIRGAWGRKQ